MAVIRVSGRRGFPLFGNTVDDSLGSMALLVVRLVFGYGIMMHGLPKIQNPFGWMDKPGAPADLPGFLQALAALSEFGGGLALIAGLFTRLGAFGILCTMAVAILKSHAGQPFVPPPGGKGFELAGLYATVALAMVIAGPGRISLDWKLFGPKD